MNSITSLVLTKGLPIKQANWDEIADKQFKALDKEWQMDWEPLRVRIQGRHDFDK